LSQWPLVGPEALGSQLHKFDLSGSHEVIGHDLIPHRPFPIGGPLEQASIFNGFREIQWRMWRNGWHDLKRPPNKGQGHSFWYQSISQIRLPGAQPSLSSIVTFALGRTVEPPQYVTLQTRQTQHCSIRATVMYGRLKCQRLMGESAMGQTNHSGAKQCTEMTFKHELYSLATL